MLFDGLEMPGDGMIKITFLVRYSLQLWNFVKQISITKPLIKNQVSILDQASDDAF